MLFRSREMQRLVPGARVVTLDSDHAPQLSARDELASVLAEFATRVAAETGAAL